MKTYVRMTDRALSGWGGARGRVAVLIIECDNMGQNEAIRLAAERRSEMKFISTGNCPAPRARPNQQVTYRHFDQMGGSWHEFYAPSKPGYVKHDAPEIPVVIAIIKAVNGMGWGYCPKGTPLERVLRYSDEKGFRSASAAIAAARADNTVPMGAIFEVQPE